MIPIVQPKGYLSAKLSKVISIVQPKRISISQIINSDIYRPNLAIVEKDIYRDIYRRFRRI